MQKCYIFDCDARTECIQTCDHQKLVVYSQKIKRIYIIKYEHQKELCDLYFDTGITYSQVQPELEQRFGEPIIKNCPEFFSFDEAIKEFPGILKKVYKIVNPWVDPILDQN